MCSRSFRFSFWVLCQCTASIAQSWLLQQQCTLSRPAGKSAYDVPMFISKGGLRAGISVAKRLATPRPLVQDELVVCAQAFSAIYVCCLLTLLSQAGFLHQGCNWTPWLSASESPQRVDPAGLKTHWRAFVCMTLRQLARGYVKVAALPAVARGCTGGCPTASAREALFTVSRVLQAELQTDIVCANAAITACAVPSQARRALVNQGVVLQKVLLELRGSMPWP